MVSSRLGKLSKESEQMKKILTNPSITEEEIFTLCRDYVEATRKKDMGHFCWTAYGTSKALINAWTRFILP